MTNLDYYSLSSIHCILVFDAISVLFVCVCVLGLIQLSAISVIGKGINLNA